MFFSFSFYFFIYTPAKKMKKINSAIGSAQDPDPLDLQDFGFLDPDPDPQKYADPRIRIQHAKYKPKTAKISA